MSICATCGNRAGWCLRKKEERDAKRSQQTQQKEITNLSPQSSTRQTCSSSKDTAGMLSSL